MTVILVEYFPFFCNSWWHFSLLSLSENSRANSVPVIIHLQRETYTLLWEGSPGRVQLVLAADPHSLQEQCSCVWSLRWSRMSRGFLALGCSWNFFSDWHLWKVNRYKTWWKSQQRQRPSLIAYLLCCFFSREISLNKEREMLQYLSHLGQGFEKFQISLASEDSLFWKHGNSSSEHYWENCFLACCFVQHFSCK